VEKESPKINKLVVILVIIILLTLPVIYLISLFTGNTPEQNPSDTFEDAAIKLSAVKLSAALHELPDIINDASDRTKPGSGNGDEQNPGQNPGQNPAKNPNPPQKPPKPEDIFIGIADEFPDLKNAIDSMARRNGCVAVSIAYFDGDAREYYLYQYGYADTGTGQLVNAETKFRMASLSKLVTAMVAMTLVDEGILDLDRDISDYLGYEVRNPAYPDTVITSRILMQHRSSIFDSALFHRSLAAEESDSLQSIIEQNTSFKRTRPGAVFEYTNLGYSVLAAVCETASGQMLDTLARTAIFDKLEIDAGFVAINLEDTSNIAVIYNYLHRPTRTVERQLEVVDSGGILGHDHGLAQGGLIISAVDYAKILVMLGNDGIFNNKRVLSSESVAAINNANDEGRGYTQGLGTRFTPALFRQGEDFYWHTGSAYGVFAQYLYSADDTNRGVVVVTTGASSAERLSNRMFRMCTDFCKLVWQHFNP